MLKSQVWSSHSIFADFILDMALIPNDFLLRLREHNDVIYPKLFLYRLQKAEVGSDKAIIPGY